MTPRKPRVGFLGVGWIGRHRMEAMIGGGAIEPAAIADPSSAMLAEAAALAPGALRVAGLDAMLALDLDGIAIATPSALHAEQAMQALRGGVAVFCQKPLGRNAAEVRAVVDAARQADRLLGVDLSYRFTAGMERIRALVGAGELGHVYAADLVFHNAYGPDKPWFYDRALAGGGCLIDLGVHLVDLALWTLDFPAVDNVSGQIFAGGERLPTDSERVEDYAVATLGLKTGAAIRIACSWRAQAGRAADISATFYGTAGGAAMKNVDGSFFDFITERYRGTETETLLQPPDAWNIRAAQDWARRLAAGDRYHDRSERLIDVADVLDRIYRGG